MDWIAPLLTAIPGLIALALVKFLPDIISKAVGKGIEHAYDKKLEDFKGDIQASNSALKSSVDYLAASQAELRSKVLSSVENLWQAIKDWETEYSSAIGLFFIMTPQELDDCVSGRSRPDLRKIFENLGDGVQFFAGKTKTIEDKLSGSEVFYVTSRLWFLYETIRKVYARTGILIHYSLKGKKYQDWRDDKLMMSALAKALPPDRIDHAKSRPIGGLRDILDWLKAEFIKEGSNIVRGSAEFEKSVSEIHSALKDQVEDRYRREN